MSLVDYSAGFVAAIALLAAVHAARRDGVGTDCDLSLYDTAISLLTYIDVSLATVADRRRIATIVAFDRARGTGIKQLGGSPGSDKGGIEIRDSARLRLNALVTEGSVEIRMGPSFPLANVAEAHRLLPAGKTQGRVVLVPEVLPRIRPAALRCSPRSAPPPTAVDAARRPGQRIAVKAPSIVSTAPLM